MSLIASKSPMERIPFAVLAALFLVFSAVIHVVLFPLVLAWKARRSDYDFLYFACLGVLVIVFVVPHLNAVLALLPR